MRASLPLRHIAPPRNAEALNKQPNVTQRLLKPLTDLAKFSDYLIAGSAGEFAVEDDFYQVPRFIFMGPTGGGDTIRLGIFAGFHGDATDGTKALVEWLQRLEESPQLARGYHLYIYPICNPTGFVARTRNNAADKNLTAEFWQRSKQPEIYYLERELGVLRFHGVISIQTDDLPGGFVVHSQSTVLNRALAEPAITAAERFLPGNIVNGQAQTDVLPDELLADFLSVTEELSPVPFELRVGIPRHLPEPSRIHGAAGALQSILESYHSFLSISPNL